MDNIGATIVRILAQRTTEEVAQEFVHLKMAERDKDADWHNEVEHFNVITWKFLFFRYYLFMTSSFYSLWRHNFYFIETVDPYFTFVTKILMFGFL